MVKKAHSILQKSYIAIIAVCIVVTAFFVSSFIPKKPELGFNRQLLNPSEFHSSIPNVFDTTISHTEKQVDVTVNREGVSLSFQLPLEQSTLKEGPNLIAFSSPNGEITTEYSMRRDGLKENIILNKIPKENIFPSTLKTQGLITKISAEGIPVFFDKDNKYQFHFERPYIKDGNGAISYAVKYRVVGQEEENAQKTQANFATELLSSLHTITQTGQTYVLQVEVDSAWLHDPKRVLPITIDPTVVHNSTSTFATGTSNDTIDTGSGSTPSIESYYQELPADKSTVGLWHMNEASGNVLDSSGNSITGTPTGTSVVSGLLGNARSFNGSTDFISIPATSKLDVQQLTIEAWTYSANYIQNGFIFEKTTNGLVNTQYSCFFAASNVFIFRTYNTVPTIDDLSIVTSSYSLDNRWNHIACVYDGSTKKIYINGIEVASKAYSQTLQTNAAGTAIIGAYGSGTSYFFNGKIDEVRVSNVARSPEEIKADASRRPYASYTSPVIDLGTKATAWNNLTWSEGGVSTGYGETVYSATNLIAQWNLNDSGLTTASVYAGSCGVTCNGTLTGFSNTSGPDVVPLSGWTRQNQRWGTAAVMFNGTTDYITVPANDGTPLDIDSGPITIETWVKPKSTAIQRILFRGTSGACGYGLSIGVNSNAKFNLGNAGGGNFDSRTTVVPETWYYVVGVINGANSQLYVNGQLEQTGTVNPVACTSLPLNIGRDPGATSYFSGIIDSTRIYTRALTANEIRSNYSSSNLEFQTRVGNTADPTDGTWEAWKPTTAENTIDSLDSAASQWKIDSNQKSSPTVASGGTINLGTGADGDCIMNNGTKTLDSTVGSSVCNGSARATAYAVNFSVTALEQAGDTSVTVSTTPTGLVAGDEFIIINLQGKSNDYQSVGEYETHIVSSVATNTLNFTDYPLSNTYDGTTQKIMVQRIPNFGNVTICGGNTGGGCTAAATLTATAWNGTKNGILFFRSNGTLTNNGTITMDSKGFAGGSPGGMSIGTDNCLLDGTSAHGRAGESIGGQTPLPSCNSIARTNNVGGGAGGVGYATWYTPSSVEGGSGGSYGTIGTSGKDGTSAVGNPGKTYGNNINIFLGSGGGSGGGWTGGTGHVGGLGGNGGGAIFISANTVTNNNTITSSGGRGLNSNADAGGNGAAGGGGSGGSIFLNANTVTLGTDIVDATGGITYLQSAQCGGRCGGNGGAGRVVISYSTALSGTTVPPAYLNKISTLLKREGAGALQYSTGNIEPDAGTIGMWHLDETGGAGAYLHDSSGITTTSCGTGGTVTLVEGSCIHNFTALGNSTFTPLSATTSVAALVVAGGGGGANTGGGGGAGGLVYNTNVSITATPYTITVGDGGNGGLTAGAAGSNGGNSIFSTITAIGGGGGSSHGGVGGANGGSGGGGAVKPAAPASTAGVGSQGNNGGIGYVDAGWVGNNSGGGGAGAVGGAGSTVSGSGAGGAGLAYSISGTATAYAGGGGGGPVNGAQTAGAGGNGGGGAGGTNAVGTAGTANTGGGGGGGAYGAGVYYNGGKGGSGTVVIKYPAVQTITYNHATPTGTSVVNGISGKARSFNGSTDRIEIGTGISPPNITLEAWVYRTSATTNMGIIRKGSAYALSLVSNTIQFAGNPWAFSNTGVGIEMNKWTHLAVTQDGKTAAVYKNGIKIGNFVQSGVLASNANQTRIGYDDNNWWWGGYIDEVRISNIARTPEEIAEAYRLGNNHSIFKTIAPTDLSTKTVLPFYIAADRPGTYLNSSFGDSSYVNYQPDASTVALFHLDDDNKEVARSCYDLRQFGIVTSGVYTVDPDGSGDGAPIQVYCNMTYDGGGWTMAVKSWYGSAMIGKSEAVGAVADATTLMGNAYKLADADVRNIIGPSNNFDVMVDQNGFNSLYSTGNYEFVVLRNYTGYWTYEEGMPASTTTTSFQSYRASDQALAWTGDIVCGYNAGAGTAGINCYGGLGVTNNPQGGAGCVINMGTTSNAGWYHFFMNQWNDDTYIYICNGAQHSSGQSMNHRFWIRERNPVKAVIKNSADTPTTDLITATGGTITYVDGYKIHTFTSSGTFQVTAGKGDVETLIVGGGGGGGSYVGGGGGGGGVYDGSFKVVPASYTVTVGNGGSGGSGSGAADNTNGQNSSVVGGTVSLIALGGGTGSRFPDGAGAAGGSGGGAGGCSAGSGAGGAAQQPSSATGGLGNAGGAMSAVARSGNDTEGRGGGGSGSGIAATNCSEPGDGATGRRSSISGTAYYYGGGGGGGGFYPGDLGTTRAGNGGAGGGGGGGAYQTGTPGTGGTGGTANGESPTLNMGALGQGIGGAGGANTGGGGGGCGHSDKGGNGGSGIVIIRYPSKVYSERNSVATGTTLTQGKIGKARYFNGTSDLISLGSPSSLQITGDQTIEMWLFPTDLSVRRNPYAKAYGGEGTITQELSGGLTYYYGTSGLNAAPYTGFASVGTIAANKWNHIAVVRDLSAMKVYWYINGQQTSVTTAPYAAATAGTLPAYIGAGYVSPYMGSIDEVRISNAVRSASDIRQAYEAGSRSHPITIDFGAKLDAGNLIANSGDLSFTVDATIYGMNQKGSNIYPDDKIIVRENYDGIEYVAQGNVVSVTAGTGAITVLSWDAGSTFPASGFTANADVFKWQREYWNITDIQSDGRNSVRQLALKLTDGNEGRSIWLDDIKSTNGYLTIPTGSSITSTTGNRYFQYRTIFTSTDASVSAKLTSVTLNYNSNVAPTLPSLDSPPKAATSVSRTPTLQTTGTDIDLDYLQYKIQLCTDAAMTLNCQTFDQTSSQTGWSAQNAENGTAYTTGMQGSYTLQTPLNYVTTYYWRSYAIDPGGANTWTGTQATPFSFTTTAVEAASSCKSTRTNDTTNTIEWTDVSGNETGYKIQRNVDNGGWVDLNPSLNPNTVSYVDSTVQLNHSYQYRIAPFIAGPQYGAWCTTQTQTVNSSVFEFSGGFNFSGITIQ